MTYEIDGYDGPYVYSAIGPIPFHWLALRDAYEASEHEPIMLNQGDPIEVPFTIDFAIEWAERLAEYELDA